MKRFLRSILVIGVACLTCVPAALAGEVRVEKIWSRATTPGADTAAVYLTLQAIGSADRLVGVDTDEAQMAMMHEAATQGGISAMRDVTGIDLPVGTPVTLRPGGGHVMLMGLARPLRKGEHFRVTLRFAVAPAVTVDVPVAGIGAASPP